MFAREAGYQNRRGSAHFAILGVLALAALVIFVSAESISKRASTTNVLGRSITDNEAPDNAGGNTASNADSQDSHSSAGVNSTSSVSGAVPGSTSGHDIGESHGDKKGEDKKPEVKKVENENENEAENEAKVEKDVEKPETEKVDVENHNGHLEVQLRSGNSSASATLSSLKLHVKENGQEQQVELNPSNQGVEFQASGSAAFTNFPLSFDKATGQLVVNTPNGPKIIRVLPDTASEVAMSAGVQNQIDKIQLITGNVPNSSEPLVFSITGKRTGYLLGLIPVSVPVDTTVGAQSGQLLQVNQPFWLQLLSPLIKTQSSSI